MGQPADRQIVDPGQGVVPGDLQRQPAGRLDLHRLILRPQGRHRLTQQRDRHVVAHDESGARGIRLESLRDGGDLDLDVDLGEGAAHRGIRRREPTRRDLVVVLDHRDVVEAHPLVGASASAHGVLLQVTHPRRRLARVEDHRPRAIEPIGPAPGVGGDPREPRDDVEHRALSDEDGSDRAGHPSHDVPAHHRGPVGDEQLDLRGGAPDEVSDRPEHLGDDRHACDHSGRAGHDVGRALLIGGNRRQRRHIDVARTEVLIEGEAHEGTGIGSREGEVWGHERS